MDFRDFLPQTILVGLNAVGVVAAIRNDASIGHWRSTIHMLDHLQLLLLAVLDRSLQFHESIPQPVHREVVDRQGARLKLSGDILDERFVELENKWSCGGGSAERNI